MVSWGKWTLHLVLFIWTSNLKTSVLDYVQRIRAGGDYSFQCPPNIGQKAESMAGGIVGVRVACLICLLQLQVVRSQFNTPLATRRSCILPSSLHSASSTTRQEQYLLWNLRWKWSTTVLKCYTTTGWASSKARLETPRYIYIFNFILFKQCQASASLT